MRPVALLTLVLLAVAGAAAFVLSRRATGPGDEAVVPPGRLEPAPPPARAKPPTHDDTPPDAGPRAVRGRVRTDDDAAIADAVVALVPADPRGRVADGVGVFVLDVPLAETRTAADGTFEVSTTVADDLAIVVRKDGFVPAAEFADPEDEEPLDVRLVPAEIREFLVTNADGRPVAGAELSHTTSGNYAPASFVTHTGADGRARVPVGDGSEYRVRAAGFATVMHSPERAASARDADALPETIVLSEGVRVAGVVVDSGGRGIAGVLVTLEGPHDGYPEAVRSDDSGEFAFDGADPTGYETGNWRLRTELDGLVAWETMVFPGDVSVRLVLRRAATVRGRVVLADGSSVVGATLWSEFRSHDEGRFECDCVAPGRRRLVVEAPSPQDARVTLHGAVWIDVPEGGVVEDVVVRLAPDPAESYVSVRVLDADGAPAAGAVLRAWFAGVEIGYVETRADGVGILRVDAPAGSRVHVTSSSHGNVVTADATTLEPVVTHVGVPPETIELRNAWNPRVRVRLVGVDGADLPFDPRVVTDGEFASDGTCAVSPASALRFGIHVPGHVAISQRLQPPHPPQREVTVRLVPAIRVTARLVRPDGTAAVPTDDSWLHVYVESSSGDPAARPDATWIGDQPEIGPDGRLDFQSLPPGPARLRIVEGSDALAILAFDVPATGPFDLGDIRLDATRTVRGLVVDGAGRGVSGARVILCNDKGAEEFGPVCTRADGTFEVEAVPSVARFAFVQCRGFATSDVPLGTGVSRTSGASVAPTGPGSAPGTGVGRTSGAPGDETREPHVGSGGGTDDADATLRLVLSEAGRVRVRTDAVRDPGQREVRFRAPGTPRPWIGRWAPDDDPLLADEPGSWVYDDLPPGPVDVLLSTPGRERVVRVNVVAGTTVDAVFGD